MGCCFSKEAEPDQAGEKSSLLRTPSRDRVHDGAEQVRHQAVAVAQHVCLDEEDQEEEAGPDRGEASSGIDSEVPMVVCEKNPQVRSSHQEEPAILIPASTCVVTDLAAGVTRSPSRSCEPAPYMEVLCPSPARQNIVENATRRALWFTQNLEARKLLQSEGPWSGPTGTGDCVRVSRDPKSSLSGQDQAPLRSEDCIVATTLGQDFQTRTRRFYSICSIDTNDLEHDDHSQTQASGSCAGPGLSRTASLLPTVSPQLLDRHLHPAPLTAASGRIPDLHVEPSATKDAPILTKAEGDSCDQMNMTEQVVSSDVRTPKETSATFQEDRLDHDQNIQAASENHKDVRHSHREPDITEQNVQEEGKNSLQGEDKVLASQNEEDETSHKKSTLTQVSSCKSVEAPRLDDDALFVETGHQMMQTEQSVSPEVQISQETSATFQNVHIHNSEPASESPKKVHSSDGREQQKSVEVEVMHRNTKLASLTPPLISLTTPNPFGGVEALGRDDEDDLCDQATLMEKDSPMVQHSQAAKEIHSCPQPEITEQQMDKDDVPEGKNQKDEVIKKNAILTQVSSPSILSTSLHQCGHLEPPGLIDEEEVSCDQMRLMQQSGTSALQTSKEIPPSFQEINLDHVQHSLPSGEHLKKGPHSRPSCGPEFDVTEKHNEEKDPCSLQTEYQEVPFVEHEEDELIRSKLTQAQVSSPNILLGTLHQFGDGKDTERDVKDMSMKVSSPEQSISYGSLQTNPNCLHTHSSSVKKACGDSLESPWEVCEGEPETTESLSDPPEPTNGPLYDGEEMVRLTSEEHPKTSMCVSSDTCRPDEVSCHLEGPSVPVEPDQLDVHALTPSYEIRSPGREAPGEESERDGGMREMVSELLAEYADAPVCRFDDRTWIGSAAEDGCRAWVRGAPLSLDAMQPAALLLGAFPSNPVLPPGPREWAWHTDRPRDRLDCVQILNPDAEVWTGCNYNSWQAQLPKEQMDPQNPCLHIELDRMSIAEMEAQPIVAENPVLLELDTGELQQQLRSVLEFCLSREQLASDLYLQSQMDEDQYVSIATLASLHVVKSLGADLQLIADVVKTVPHVQISPCGQKVRADRNQYVLILREIPSSTPRQEVEALFADEKLPKFLSCEFVSSDNWFVTFRSEADAYQVYKYLREELGVFQGKPIKVRMKAKSTSFPSCGPSNGFGATQSDVLADHRTSYLPPEAYGQFYDFTYTARSGSGYSDCAELGGAPNATSYVQLHGPRRNRRGGRTSGSNRKDSAYLAKKPSGEISAPFGPARGWAHSRGGGPRHDRRFSRLTGPPSLRGRSVNGGPRRRGNPRPAGVQHKERSPPRQPSPIELGVTNFPPLGVEKTPEPTEASPASADDVASEASQKLSYAAICRKSSPGRAAPPAEGK